jgi:1-acyl-sn-glycerol-3-phosphate acyltransferase
VVYEFLPAIPAGMKRDAFMAVLEERLEGASGALLQAAEPLKEIR